jgi:hypothetical protein
MTWMDAAMSGASPSAIGPPGGGSQTQLKAGVENSSRDSTACLRGVEWSAVVTAPALYSTAGVVIVGLFSSLEKTIKRGRRSLNPGGLKCLDSGRSRR